MAKKSKENIEENRIDGVRAGNREGIQKKDIYLYELIKHSGLNMKYVAEKAYAEGKEVEKKHVVRLYQKLYNMQDISDEELKQVRTAVFEIVHQMNDLLKKSEKLSERKRKIKLFLETSDEKKIDELLNKMEDK